jgi:hypothetical protein
MPVPLFVPCEATAQTSRRRSRYHRPPPNLRLLRLLCRGRSSTINVAKPEYTVSTAASTSYWKNLDGVAWVWSTRLGILSSTELWR